QAEVAAAAPQRTAARFWLGKLALSRGDTATAEATWTALAHEDSIGYYGLRARRAVALPPLRLAAPPLPAPPPAVATSLARLDTLVLAGLDTAAEAEVRTVAGRRAWARAAYPRDRRPHRPRARRHLLPRLDHRPRLEPAPRCGPSGRAAASLRGARRRRGGRVQRRRRARGALAGSRGRHRP